MAKPPIDYYSPTQPALAKEPDDLAQAQVSHQSIDINESSQHISPAGQKMQGVDTQSEHIALSGVVVIQQALVKLLQLARREVLIVLPALPVFLDEHSINQHLLNFVRDSAKRQVFILINSLDDLSASHHLLVKLAQRLPSRLQLRQTVAIAEAPVKPADYVIIIDRKHMIRIDNIEQSKGWLTINCEFRAQQYAASLLHQWPRSQEIAEFRQFHL